MGENGREAVLEKYNWETESKKLLALYSELLGGTNV
jgi:glycosyltransferase involved in cell wall biosynthesis